MDPYGLCSTEGGGAGDGGLPMSSPWGDSSGTYANGENPKRRAARVMEEDVRKYLPQINPDWDGRRPGPSDPSGYEGVPYTDFTKPYYWGMLVDFAAGTADGMSLGITYYARELFGWNETVNLNSTAYKAGGWTGTVLVVATGVGGVAKGITKGAAKIVAKRAQRKAIKGRIGCFVAGTLVLTASGAMAIEDLQQDDQVWSYDHHRDEWVLSTVLATSVREYEGEIITVTVLDPTHGQLDTIEATDNHPFWVSSGVDLALRPRAEELPDWDRPAQGRWIEAGDLHEGDILLSRAGEPLIAVDLVHDTRTTLVYNLTTAVGNYLVGDVQTLVHNACPLGYVGHLEPGVGVRRGRALYTMDEVLRHLRHGGDLIAANRRIAKDVARKIGNGRPIQHSHQRRHFHPRLRGKRAMPQHLWWLGKRLPGFLRHL